MSSEELKRVETEDDHNGRHATRILKLTDGGSRVELHIIRFLQFIGDVDSLFLVQPTHAFLVSSCVIGEKISTRNHALEY